MFYIAVWIFLEELNDEVFLNMIIFLVVLFHIFYIKLA
jgi:hypothetical protein